MYHLPFLAQVHELSRRDNNWISVDQIGYVYGFNEAITDESLCRTAALPPSQQMGPSGFGTGASGECQYGAFSGPPSVELSFSAPSRVAGEGPPANISPPVVASIWDDHRLRALEANYASMAERIKLIAMKAAPGLSVSVAQEQVVTLLLAEGLSLPPQSLVQPDEEVAHADLYKSEVGSVTPHPDKVVVSQAGETIDDTSRRMAGH